MIRLLDILFSLIGIAVLLPLFLISAIWIKLDSKGPIIYRQVRIGKRGKPFELLKFRSMRVNADKAGLLTVGGRDQRITTSGFWLRKTKLDEIPQFINVLLGDMSFVGPRPEVEKYTSLYTEEQQKALQVKPGITDNASIEFRNENEILSQQKDPEQYYIEVIMPKKLEMNRAFIEDPSIGRYLSILYRTFVTVISK